MYNLTKGKNTMNLVIRQTSPNDLVLATLKQAGIIPYKEPNQSKETCPVIYGQFPRHFP